MYVAKPFWIIYLNTIHFRQYIYFEKYINNIWLKILISVTQQMEPCTNCKVIPFHPAFTMQGQNTDLQGSKIIQSLHVFSTPIIHHSMKITWTPPCHSVLMLSSKRSATPEVSKSFGGWRRSCHQKCSCRSWPPWSLLFRSIAKAPFDETRWHELRSKNGWLSSMPHRQSKCAS